MRCPWEWVCSASEDTLLAGYSTFWTRVVVEVLKSAFLGSDNHAAVNFANISVLSTSLEHSNSDTERLPVRTHLGLVLLVQFVFSAQYFFLVVCSSCHWWPWSQWPGPVLPSLYDLFWSPCLTFLSPLILLTLSPYADFSFTSIVLSAWHPALSHYQCFLGDEGNHASLKTIDNSPTSKLLFKKSKMAFSVLK